MRSLVNRLIVVAVVLLSLAAAALLLSLPASSLDLRPLYRIF